MSPACRERPEAVCSAWRQYVLAQPCSALLHICHLHSCGVGFEGAAQLLQDAVQYLAGRRVESLYLAGCTLALRHRPGEPLPGCSVLTQAVLPQLQRQVAGGEGGAAQAIQQHSTSPAVLPPCVQCSLELAGSCVFWFMPLLQHCRRLQELRLFLPAELDEWAQNVWTTEWLANLWLQLHADLR